MFVDKIECPWPSLILFQIIFMMNSTKTHFKEIVSYLLIYIVKVPTYLKLRQIETSS